MANTLHFCKAVFVPLHNSAQPFHTGNFYVKIQVKFGNGIFQCEKALISSTVNIIISS